MGSKIFFSLLFFIFVVSMLTLYWFVPLTTTEFKTTFNKKPNNYNFTLDNSKEEQMQFYPKMRFPESKISYRIENCPLKKEEDMRLAFEQVSNKTILKFYPTNFNEEIFVTCEEGSRIEEGLFIAGEGGPTNFTKTDNFNVILNGKILLFRESKCYYPNIAIHELFHVLGFNHSKNPDNIMYPISKCDQTIGQDQIDLINELYSIEGNTDLKLEEAAALMHGKYLNINMTIKNVGLKKSKETKIIIFVDEEPIKKITLEELNIGDGITINLKNMWVKKINIQEIKIQIDYPEKELNKDNNHIILSVKK